MNNNTDEQKLELPSIIMNWLRWNQRHMTPELALFLLVRTLKLFAWLEKIFFLYYAKHTKNPLKTLEKIRANPFCPSTVMTIYRFWLAHPEHEAFEGMPKVHWDT